MSALLIRRAYRYRIYPTDEQVARLEAWDSALRFLWNIALEQRLIGLAHPRGFKKFYSGYDQMRQLTELRAELPWLADVPRNVCEAVLARLDGAWQRCFKRLARRPQWKRKGVDNIGMSEEHAALWSIDGASLHFPKLGPVRSVVHRSPSGRPRSCTITRDGDRWFASLLYEAEILDPPPRTAPIVGIDRGCVNLLADSDGRIVLNPRYVDTDARRLARSQRVVSRRKKGSKNRDKAKRRVARIHQDIRSRREHLLHCESKRYANSHGVVVVERLQIENMVAAGGSRKRGLNRSISGTGWGRFVEMLRYKATERGGTAIEVPAAYTSQTCSMCGVVDAASRRLQSDFACTSCGVTLHADTNAARNILSRGIHGGAACGGSAEVRRPVRQERGVARRHTQVHDSLSEPEG